MNTTTSPRSRPHRPQGARPRHVRRRRGQADPRHRRARAAECWIRSCCWTNSAPTAPRITSPVSPSHPHRGFETVTYMLDGRMRHKDNHGNEGLLVPGSVQWMTAGRGLVHSEMPEQESGPHARLPAVGEPAGARTRWTDPKYQEFAPERIPVAQPAPGVNVKVIAGEVGDVLGPIVQPATDPLYLDIALRAGDGVGVRAARRPQRIRLCVRRRRIGGRGRRRASRWKRRKWRCSAAATLFSCAPATRARA